MTNCKNCTTNCVYRGKDNESRCRSFVGIVTNADRIRAMTDEELEKFIKKVANEGWLKVGLSDVSKWLQQPAEATP